MDSAYLAIIVTIAIAAIGATWILSAAINGVRDEVRVMVGRYENLLGSHQDLQLRVKDIEKHIWDK